MYSNIYTCIYAYSVFLLRPRCKNGKSGHSRANRIDIMLICHINFGPRRSPQLPAPLVTVRKNCAGSCGELRGVHLSCFLKLKHY